MSDLKAIRKSIRLSLYALARQAGVSRFRLWSSEKGEVTLTADEKDRIRRVLRTEAERLIAALDSAETAA